MYVHVSLSLSLISYEFEIPIHQILNLKLVKRPPCLPACLPVCLSVCLSVRPSVCLYTNLSYRNHRIKHQLVSSFPSSAEHLSGSAHHRRPTFFHHFSIQQTLVDHRHNEWWEPRWPRRKTGSGGLTCFLPSSSALFFVLCSHLFSNVALFF